MIDVKWGERCAAIGMAIVAVVFAIPASAAERDPVAAAPALAGPTEGEAESGDAVEAAAPKRADADKAAVRDRDWSVAAFLLNYTETRLPRFPYKALTGDLPLRKSYLASVAVSKTVVPRFAIPLPFFKLRGNSLELEGQLGQHFGHERSAEATAAAIIRSGQFGLLGRTSANVAWGNGFSYSLTPPTYEKGPGGIVGVDSVQFQYHMSFETEVTSAAAPHIHYVLRLHHRSGIYGVISPSRTGSNYLGLGVRLDIARRGAR